MGNITKHPTRVVQELVDNLNKNARFAKFLRCVSYILQNGLEETTISKWWTENWQRLKSSNPEVEFSCFLRDIEICAEIIDEPHPPVEGNAGETLEGKLLGVIETFAEQEKEDREKAQGEFSKYWAFKPAWPFHTILPKVFPDRDPAFVIATYLKQIFPSLYGHASNGRVASRNAVRLIHGSQSYQLMLEVSRWVASQTTPVVGDLFEYVLWHPTKMVWRGSTEDFLRAATSRSHSLFEVVMDAWRSSNHGPILAKGEELIILLDLPFSKDPDVAGPPHLTPNNLGIVVCDHAYDVASNAEGNWKTCQKTGKQAWDSFFKRYRDFRFDDLREQSPADIETADHLRNAVEGLPWSAEEIETDFTIHLAECWNDWNGMLVPWCNGDEAPVYPEPRAEKYLLLFNKVCHEGYFELANALLAFFLFSQSLIHKGRLGSDTEIYTAIKKGMELPGVDMLSRGVDFSAQIAEESKNQLLATKLRQFIPGNSYSLISDDVRLLGDIIRQPSSANSAFIERWYVKKLTEKRWKVLADLSRDALKDARLAHIKLLGEKKNWGTVAVEYCKPFEHEIRIRFTDVYKIYKPAEKDGHVDVAAVIGMLIKHKKLDPDIQAKIVNTGTELHNNTKLLESIKHILVDYRNRGAHPNEFPEDELNKLFTTLFDDGVLSRFIDVLGQRQE